MGGQPSTKSHGELAFLEQSKMGLLCAALRPLAAKWGPPGVFSREACSVVAVAPAPARVAPSSAFLTLSAH